MHPGNVGIVLGHEVWGVTGALRAAADRLRDLGFRMAVPDLYRGQLATSYPPAAALRDQLRLHDIQYTIVTALDQLRQAGTRRTAFVGYSMGGAIALWAATCMEFDLCLTLYGGGLRQPYWPAMAPGVELSARLTTPWLGFYGAQDPLTPPADLNELADAAARAPEPGRVVVIPDAGHGFALDPTDPRHHPAATAAIHDALLTRLAALPE